MNPALFLLLCLVIPCMACMAWMAVSILIAWVGAWRTPPYKGRRL